MGSREMATVQDIEWMTGRDTGLSSMCVWRTMNGVPEPSDSFYRGSYPLDPDDLGRIIRLLDRNPEWYWRIHEMVAHGPVWCVLVDCFDEIVALYREEEPSGRAPKCYDRMSAAIDLGRATRDG